MERVRVLPGDGGISMILRLHGSYDFDWWTHDQYLLAICLGMFMEMVDLLGDVSGNPDPTIGGCPVPGSSGKYCLYCSHWIAGHDRTPGSRVHWFICLFTLRLLVGEL